MAVYPCSVHGARYNGPQRSVYVASLHNGESERRRLRLCKLCFEDLLDVVQTHMIDATSPDQEVRCFSCELEGGDVALFATIYDYQSDRADYFGRCHVGQCTTAAIHALKML